MHASNINEVMNESYSDWKYLSRFVVTLECENGFETSWNEWIEPLTLHARHPFFAIENTTKLWLHGKSPANFDYMMNVDYILLQSATSQYNHTANFDASGGPAKHFLFDVGSSTWDSSSWWYTCGYNQVRVAVACKMSYILLYSQGVSCFVKC